MKMPARIGIVAIAAIAACLSVPQSASAQSSDRIMFFGMIDCGSWIEWRKKNNATTYEHHLVGIMNGLALGTGVEFWNARGVLVSDDQVNLWMDKYCRDNPLEILIKGATVLFEERTGRPAMPLPPSRKK